MGILLLALGATSTLGAPQTLDVNKDGEMAALKSEIEQAMTAVRTIVNQPVAAVRRTREMRVGTFAPGWFHEGAAKPDFNTVDIRQTRDTAGYDKHPYVTSDLNPGLAWVSRTVEFNPATKYFYTNYSLPKKRLTEAEMVEINRLYRIIGQKETSLAELTRPILTEEELEDPEAGWTLKPIPKERYILAGVAIAVVLGVYFVSRRTR
ncbi:MAG TPA: hypothetical protein DCY13_21650 [Verrucomicrobiales bacterium]|nr:hypothetical protein [Verrucomicrobiales bacterium]